MPGLQKRISQRSKPKGKLFVISGPSGSGKTTLAERILQDKRLKEFILRSISFTTRPKRKGEIDKKDYLFVSEDDFKERLKKKKILEWTKYLGYYYGTPREFVDSNLKNGRHILLCLDIRGAKKIKRMYPKDSVTIFIEPPSLKVLRRRLSSRSNLTKEGDIQERLKLAQEEMKESSHFDYCLVNQSLEKVTSLLKKIIFTEIKFRQQR